MSRVPAGSFLETLHQRNKTRQIQQTNRTLPALRKIPLSFADNDYLGLSQHPEVIKASQQALEQYGAGAKAARLLAPHCVPHQQLEKALARWKSTENALLFAAGYLTPLGVIPSLVAGPDTVVLERNAHACLFDGAKLSSAKIRLFGRQKPEELATILAQTRKLNPEGKILIVAESMHSMDGDLLPLKEVVQLKDEFDAWLLLDEAHAGGVLGPSGIGWAAELGLSSHVDIQMGTLGKALGSSGGFVAGSTEIVHHLMNEARTFLFGTALAPSQAAAALAALQIIQSREGEELRAKLHQNIATFQTNRVATLPGPIQPIPCPDNQTAVNVSRRLADHGMHVPAIRPPTVPEGTARLRVSLSSRQSPDDVKRLCQCLHEFLPHQ